MEKVYVDRDGNRVPAGSTAAQFEYDADDPRVPPAPEPTPEPEPEPAPEPKAAERKRS